MYIFDNHVPGTSRNLFTETRILVNNHRFASGFITGALATATGSYIYQKLDPVNRVKNLLNNQQSPQQQQN